MIIFKNLIMILFTPSYFQSPSLSDNTIDTSGHDDASSSGAKDDDDDDDDDDVNDEKIDGQLCGDPEKLKAFNVSIFRDFIFVSILL